MKKRDLKRDRNFLTLRLLPEDRELLQDLGRGVEGVRDRHEALLRLVEIVKNEAIPDEPPQPERRSLRLGIPAELNKAIKTLAKKRKETYLSILLRAAREYRRAHPGPWIREERQP